MRILAVGRNWYSTFREQKGRQVPEVLVLKLLFTEDVSNELRKGNIVVQYVLRKEKSANDNLSKLYYKLKKNARINISLNIV